MQGLYLKPGDKKEVVALEHLYSLICLMVQKKLTRFHFPLVKQTFQ